MTFPSPSEATFCVLGNHNTCYIMWFVGRLYGRRLNGITEHFFSPCILAGQIPGPVAVTIVHTLTGGVLGETTFEYVDEVGNVLELLLRDQKLQARYFHLLAKELERRPSSPPRPDNTPKPHSSQLTGKALAEAMLCRLSAYSWW